MVHLFLRKMLYWVRCNERSLGKPGQEMEGTWDKLLTSHVRYRAGVRSPSHSPPTPKKHRLTPAWPRSYAPEMSERRTEPPMSIMC